RVWQHPAEGEPGRFPGSSAEMLSHRTARWRRPSARAGENSWRPSSAASDSFSDQQASTEAFLQ
ncbi:hypothetical protein Q6284_34310, partial [Klebsiella pneumoniae]|uniref:hypothetical protein n=1 Tax=Klebsiella pneumoniae TaxID=573 RepID=UPI002731BA19